MKALDYGGPRKVQIKDVPDPKIEQPTDALVKLPRRTFVALTFTCTKAEPAWNKAKYSVTKTSVS